MGYSVAGLCPLREDDGPPNRGAGIFLKGVKMARYPWGDDPWPPKEEMRMDWWLVALFASGGLTVIVSVAAIVLMAVGWKP